MHVIAQKNWIGVGNAHFFFFTGYHEEEKTKNE